MFFSLVLGFKYFSNHKLFLSCMSLCNKDGETEAWPVKLLPSLIKKTKQECVLNVVFVHLTLEEKEKRRAARAAAEANNGGKKGRAKQGKAKKGKRKRADNDNDDSSSSDDSGPNGGN